MNNRRYDTFKVKARNITLPETYSWSSRTVARAKGLGSGDSVRNQEGNISRRTMQTAKGEAT